MSESNIERPCTNRETTDAGANRLTLDAFVRRHSCTEGISIDSLEAGTVLSVHTQHSRYRIVVLDHTEHRALVTGGAVFPTATEVRLEGATAGGSLLKMGWIGVGLRLELSIGRRRITTSRVRAVMIESVPSLTPMSDTRIH